MKKIIALAIMALMFSGCTSLTDAIKNPTLTRIYDTTKVVYVNGREIVISNYDLIPDDVKTKLEKLDAKVQDADEKIKELVK